jgi:hypothetical protein
MELSEIRAIHSTDLWAAGPVVYAVEGFDWRTYWGRDKGMPNGWSFNWESMATGKGGA